MFLLLKYQKLLTFLVKNPKKNCHVFLRAFIWNHPYVKRLTLIFMDKYHQRWQIFVQKGFPLERGCHLEFSF